MGDMATDSKDLVEYRLTNIEKALVALQNGIEQIKSALQKAETGNELQNRDILFLRDAVKDHEIRIKTLEESPLKDKADKWQKVADYFFKLALVVIGGLILAKLNIQVSA